MEEKRVYVVKVYSAYVPENMNIQELKEEIKEIYEDDTFNIQLDDEIQFDMDDISVGIGMKLEMSKQKLPQRKKTKQWQKDIG